MDPLPARKKLAALGMLTILVLLVYSNTFEASWHLDDYPNIVHNPRAHLHDLHPNSMFRALYIGDGAQELLNRPLARLTLALNWYGGQGAVRGFHLINLGLHVATAYLLFLTVCTLFRSPRLKGQGQSNAYAVALLGSVLWALNPVQTQAVTYIVQRMAILAALFYVLGMLLYLKGRLAETPREAGAFFAGCGVSFFLGLASKENALLLPAALLLLEIVFFQDLADRSRRRRFGAAVLAVVLVVGVVGVTLLWQRGSLETVLRAYEQRSFSLAERLLTQPRVLVFYLGQLFYPLPTRLSVEHDVAVSSGLLTPWTTSAALLAILGLIGLSLARLRANPWLAFALLFFFLNHVIESSIIPLEMVFEHRNYLPSLFLFVPVAGLWCRGLDVYRSRRHLFYVLLAAAVPFVVTAFGVGTYVRNMAWATEKTLWQDASAKAPRSARPYYNLAKYYYKPRGLLQEALASFQHAFESEAAFPNHSRALALNGMAGIYYVRKDYARVITLCNQALTHNPDFASARHNIALAAIHLGQWQTAADALAYLLAREPGRQTYLNWMALVLMQQGAYDRARVVLQRALRHNAFDYTTNLYMGAVFGLSGRYAQGAWFLRRAMGMTTNRTWPLLRLTENRVLAEDKAGARRYATRVLRMHSIEELRAVLDAIDGDHFHPPLKREPLCLVLAAQLDETAGMILNPARRRDGSEF